MAVAGKGPTLPTLHISSLLFVCALLPARLFKGPQLEFFAIAQIALAIWLRLGAVAILRSWREGRNTTIPIRLA